MIIRPSFTVIIGAAVGLVAGAAVYGAVSSAATPTMKATKAAVLAAPAAAAHCAKGQVLEEGACVIHVVRTIVVPAPAAAQVPTGSRMSEDSPDASSTGPSASPSAASDDATKAPASTTKAPEAMKPGDDAVEENQVAKGATDGSASDDSANEAVNDDSVQASH